MPLGNDHAVEWWVARLWALYIYDGVRDYSCVNLGCVNCLNRAGAVVAGVDDTFTG